MSEAAHDAILLLSFGGPEGPDDVIPFLQNVTRGRDVPRERLDEVAGQYDQFGGVSPINEQNRALLAALRAELDRRGHSQPLYWGNRNWTPYVEDTMAEITAAGHRRVLALTTSAYSSYSACRQYHEDIERARRAVGDDAPVVDKIRPYWNHPGFIDAMFDRVSTALDDHADIIEPTTTRIVFTAHSLPVSMAETSDYVEQLRDAAALVIDRLGTTVQWDLAFQSRSGPPQVPWLEPDIADHLTALAGGGVDTAVVVPIGFVSDHMEVVYDLDTQAAAVAENLGLTMVRVPTVGTHPRFVAGLVDILEEHLLGTPAQALGPLGPRVNPCLADCCPAPRRPGVRPTRP